MSETTPLRIERLATIEGHGDIRRLTLRAQLRTTPAVAWLALTSIESLRVWWPDWLPGGVFDHEEGGRVVIGDGSWLDGRVKVWAPPHVLELTWREHSGGSWFEPVTKSLVRFELLATSAGTTSLTLVQFAPAGSVVGGTAGWHSFVERLQRLLAREPQVDDAGRFDELVSLYTLHFESRDLESSA